MCHLESSGHLLDLIGLWNEPIVFERVLDQFDFICTIELIVESLIGWPWKQSLILKLILLVLLWVIRLIRLIEGKQAECPEHHVLLACVDGMWYGSQPQSSI